MPAEPQKRPDQENAHSDWRVMGRQLVFDATPWVQLYREQLQLPSGSVIEDFYRVGLPDFTVVIALTESQQFVMVRGYKHAVGGPTLSPPCGMIEVGEPPLASAQRELLEESGYVSQDWKKIGQYITDGNRHCGEMHLFLAKSATLQEQPQHDETEPLLCELLSAQQVQAAMLRGEIRSLPGVAAIALGLLMLGD